MHFRYFAHPINMIAEGSIKEVHDLLDLICQVRNTVKFIKTSVKYSVELRKLQGKGNSTSIFFLNKLVDSF